MNFFKEVIYMTILSNVANNNELEDTVKKEYEGSYDPIEEEKKLREHESLDNELRIQKKSFDDRMLEYDKQIAESLNFNEDSFKGKIISFYSKFDKNAFRKVAQKNHKSYCNDFDKLQRSISELDKLIEGDIIYQTAKDDNAINDRKIEAQNNNVGMRYKFELARDEADYYLNKALKAKTGIKESENQIAYIEENIKKYQDTDDVRSEAKIFDAKLNKKEIKRKLARCQSLFDRYSQKANGAYIYAKDLGGELKKKELERSKAFKQATQINVILNYANERLSQDNPEEKIRTYFNKFDSLAKNFGKLRKSIQQRNNIRLNDSHNYLADQNDDLYELVHKDHNNYMTRSLNNIDDLGEKINSL